MLFRSTRQAAGTSIFITDKRGNTYSWSTSNPRGYAEWFHRHNQSAPVLVRKEDIIGSMDVYAKVDEVPEQLVRTVLQRVIQIIKRHRDVYFNSTRNKDFAPISIIITTLVTQLYRSESEADIYSALKGIISRLAGYEALMLRPDSSLGTLIQRTSDGRWYIGNPVQQDENFADRWHEDNHARAKAFFVWVHHLRKDLVAILDEKPPTLIPKHFSAVLCVTIPGSDLGLTSTPPRVHITKPVKPFGGD